jgi:hypothetical protein
MPPTTKGRVLSRVDKALTECLDEVPELAEVLVVSDIFSRQKGMKGVMEVVVPLRVQAVTSEFPRTDYLGVVEGTFGDDIDTSPESLCLLVHSRGQFFQKGIGRKIQDGVDGIDSEGINVKLRDPIKGIFDKKTADLIAVWPIEVDGETPGGFVTVGEIGSKMSQIIPFRPQMIVYHVQNHWQFLLVAGVYQPLKLLGPPVGVLYGKRVDPVVSPISTPGKLSDRHELDSGHPQCFQLVQMTNDREESPFGSKGSHVEFIDNKALQPRSEPRAVIPWKTRVNHMGWPVDTLRLESRGWVWPVLIPIQTEKVQTSGFYRLQDCMMVASVVCFQRHDPVSRGNDVHRYLLDQRGPDAELAAALSQIRGAEAVFRIQLSLPVFHSSLTAFGVIQFVPFFQFPSRRSNIFLDPSRIHGSEG